MPWTSSHFCFEADRTKPSKFPRGWSPWPPQLADERRGMVIFDHTGDLSRWYWSSRGRALIAAPRFVQFLVRERLGTGYELSCIRIDITPLSETVLDGHDLLIIPVCPEGAEDPAMI